MSAIDDLLRNNITTAKDHSGQALPAAPRRKVAVVACMDARMDIPRLLGLEPGDAHVMRNAGGVVTDDVIRSLVVSQRKLGTQEIMLIQHTRCGMASFDGTAFASESEVETGERPPFSMETFTDLEANLRLSIDRVKSSPWLLHRDAVRAFVYDVDSGRLREVS